MKKITQAPNSVNGKAKREELERQLLVERNLPMLEHVLLIGVIRSQLFYRLIRSRVCPPSSTGLPGSRRHDFVRADFNRVFAIVARYYDGLTSPETPGDYSIDIQTLHLLLTKEVEAERMQKEVAEAIEIWLVPDAMTLEFDQKFLFGLPSTPVFLQWQEDRVSREGLDRLQFQAQTGTGRITIADWERCLRAVKQASRNPTQDFVVTTIDDIISDDGEAPEWVVEGLVPIARVCTLSSRAKSHKSFTAIDLSLSAPAAHDWLGFRLKRSLAVYVNFELGQKTLRARIKKIAYEKGIDLEKLRGWFTPISVKSAGLLKETSPTGSRHAFTEAMLERLADKIEACFEAAIEANRECANAPRVVCLDSFYNLHGGKLNENDAGDVSFVYHLVREFGERLNAAVIVIHHFSKGDPNQKMSGDRAAGSRVHRQAPDTYIELVPHQLPGAYIFESDLRDYPAIEKFCVRWHYPILRRAPELDPEAVKQAGGRKKKYSIDDILAVLGDRALQSKEWAGECEEKRGISHATFYRLRDQAEQAGRVAGNREGKWVVTGVSEIPPKAKS
jgi:hypothetical protein